MIETPVPGKRVGAAIVDLELGATSQLTGLETIRSLRRQRRDLPIAALSSTRSRDDQVRSAAAGANTFIPSISVREGSYDTLERELYIAIINQSRTSVTSQQQDLEALNLMMLGYIHDIARQTSSIRLIEGTDVRSRALSHLEKMNHDYLENLRVLRERNVEAKTPTSRVCLKSWLNEVVRLMREFLPHRYEIRPENVHIKVDLADSGPLEIEVHLSMLQRSIENVIDNAVKVQESDIDVEIVVERINQPSAIQIHIDDNGPGFARLADGRFYAPLTRGPSARRSGFGCGLSATEVLMRHCPPGDMPGHVHIGRASILKGARVTLHVPQPGWIKP